MKYKLLAIDMDGTFLNEEHNVTEGNLAAIKKVADKGIKVAICSGRIPTSLEMFTKYIPENQPMIAGNGSLILDENRKELYFQPLKNDRVFKIISMLKEGYENIFYSFVDSKAIYFEKAVVEKINFLKKINDRLPEEERIQIRLIEDSLKYIKENEIKVLKIEIYDNNPLELLQEIRNKLDKLTDIEVASTGREGMEISNKGVNKGNSLEILVKHYGYSLCNCIAIGNDENDLEMIKVAGLGVAVKNAKESVKKVADYVTERDNNNDAVAEVIDKFILL